MKSYIELALLRDTIPYRDFDEKIFFNKRCISEGYEARIKSIQASPDGTTFKILSDECYSLFRDPEYTFIPWPEYLDITTDEVCDILMSNIIIPPNSKKTRSELFAESARIEARVDKYYGRNCGALRGLDREESEEYEDRQYLRFKRKPDFEACVDEHDRPNGNYMVTYDRYHTGVKCWVHDHFQICARNWSDSVTIGNGISGAAYVYGCALEAIDNGKYADPVAAYNYSVGWSLLLIFDLSDFYLEWLNRQRVLDLYELELRRRTQQAQEFMGISGDSWRRVRPVEIPILKSSDAKK